MKAQIEIDEKILSEATAAELQRLREHVLLLQQELAETKKQLKSAEARADINYNDSRKYEEVYSRLAQLIDDMDRGQLWGEE